MEGKKRLKGRTKVTRTKKKTGGEEETQTTRRRERRGGRRRGEREEGRERRCVCAFAGVGIDGSIRRNEKRSIVYCPQGSARDVNGSTHTGNGITHTHPSTDTHERTQPLTDTHEHTRTHTDTHAHTASTCAHANSRTCMLFACIGNIFHSWRRELVISL